MCAVLDSGLCYEGTLNLAVFLFLLICINFTISVLFFFFGLHIRGIAKEEEGMKKISYLYIVRVFFKKSNKIITSLQ